MIYLDPLYLAALSIRDYLKPGISTSKEIQAATGIIDEYGNSVLIAYLRPLSHGGFFMEPATEILPLLLGENNDGLYDDLPYFLFDLRPQGFLGRQIAQEMASQCRILMAFWPSHQQYRHASR